MNKHSKIKTAKGKSAESKWLVSTADRLKGVGEYYFSRKLSEIEKLNREGRNIINLGIGSPDLPPHQDVIRVLNEESIKPHMHAYQPYRGSPVLRNAISAWYNKWYGVDLDPDSEILPLIGSKEGLLHICMTYLGKKDRVLVPNPGYPAYRNAVTLAGGKCIEYKLAAKNNYKPDFRNLSEKNLDKVKLMFVNYPHMPTGQLPDRQLFESLVDFGRRNTILIVHDNPYGFILNDSPASILSIRGAMEYTIELNSLSKSHNMAGWRVGMLCGAKDRIDEVLRFKSNMDSGMFLPVQLAAAKALALSKDWHDNVNRIYAERREKVFRLLDLLKCSYSPQQAGLFVWAKVSPTPVRKDAGWPLREGLKKHPLGWGGILSDELLYHAGVFITPGGIFGSAGNKYVRVSLCAAVEKINDAIKRVIQ